MEWKKRVRCRSAKKYERIYERIAELSIFEVYYGNHHWLKADWRKKNVKRLKRVRWNALMSRQREQQNNQQFTRYTAIFKISSIE